MSVLRNDEFEKKYNYHLIEKCCFNCKHSSGYIECLDCTHPENKTDDGHESMVDATAVCNVWEKKSWDDYND